MQATKISYTEIRAALEAEIEATRVFFVQLVQTLPGERWAGRAPGSSWTGKQLLHHVTWALEQLPNEVESAKQGKGMFNYPKFLADHGSYWLVKWEARKATRESIVARYEAAVERVHVALQGVKEADWQRGARFYGEGFYSVEDLFHTAAKHCQEHTAALASG